MLRQAGLSEKNRVARYHEVSPVANVRIQVQRLQEELRTPARVRRRDECEECGKGTAKRVLVAPRVVFKGSGWYATDSRGKSSATAESDSKGESTETKPDAAAKETKSNESKSKESRSSESKPESTAESSAAS